MKSLFQFKCVSKSWLSLIGSDRFIKTHLRNSTKNPSLANHIAVFNRNRHELTGCSLQSLLNWKEGSIANPINNLPYTGMLVGCCNGVLCYFNHEALSFFLWNPAIRVSIELPPMLRYELDRKIPKCGFGWDERSGAYKVFALMSNYHNFNERIGGVYSSKTNSWRRVPHGSLALFSPISQFLHGKFHWAFYDKHEIECMDLESEEFGTIELPSDAMCRSQSWLGEIGGCLSILFDYKSYLDVWVMKESWLKLATLPLAVGVSLRRTYAFTPLFGGCLNGEIFIIYGDAFMVYSPKYGVRTTSCNIISFYEAHVYVESLVSPRTILGHYDT